MTETKKPTIAKYEGPGYVPGVPARDLTEDDLAELGTTEMELLRRDAERETPFYKHSKTLGHSEFFKAAREREKTDKAAAPADAEKKGA